MKVIVTKETKEFRVEVGSPTTAAPSYSRSCGLEKDEKLKEEIAGNITLEQVINIS